MNTAVQMSRRSALSVIAGALVSLGAGTSARSQGRGQGSGGNNGGSGGNGRGDAGNNGSGGNNGNGGGTSGNGGNNGNGSPGGNANSNAGGKSANTGSAASGNLPSASASSTASIDVPGDPVAQEHDLAMQAVEEGRVLPMRNLMVQVETKFRAEVIDAKLLPGRNGLIYELKMLSEQGRVFVVSVNAATGLP